MIFTSKRKLLCSVYILTFISLSVACAQRSDIRQLEAQLQVAPNPELVTTLSKAYQEQALWFFKTPQFNNDSTLFYFNKALVLLENTQPVQNDLLAELYKNLSEYRFLRSESQLAAEMGAKALSFFEKTDKTRQNDMLHYDILRYYARAELKNDNRKLALDLFTTSLSLFQNEKNSGITAMLWKDKGVFYTDFRNGVRAETQEALNDLLKSAEFYETSNKKNLLFLAEIYDALAWSYNVEETGTNKGIADSCDLYYSKLYALLPQLQNPIFEAKYYSYWGNKLFRRGNLEEALKLAQQSQRIIDTFHLEYHRILPFNLNILGAIAGEKKQWEQAEFYFTKARDIGLKQKGPNSERTYLTHMVGIYQAKGDYKNAFIASNSFWAINAKLQEERSLNNLQESELQLNVLRQEKELVQKNAERNLFFIAALIALILLGLLVFIFLRERRSKVKLAEQNHIIEEQSQALRQLDAAKTRFFANVSHELRTPLTLMLGPLSTALKSNTLDNKNFTLVSLVKQHAKQLLGLVNEILDLTKLESGKMSVHEEPTDVYNFLRRLVATFESYAEQKQINLIFDFDADAPRGLMLDKPKVERIFNNLLSNALKFTSVQGSITVKISHTPSTWQLAVTDTGRGIHPNDLPHLFNRFYQTNQTDVPLEGGTGIGLALSKELAQVLGGTLTVESTLGTGATFTLDLPKREVLGLPEEQLVETEEDDVILETKDITPSVLSNKNDSKIEQPTILVVEDNPSLRSYLTLILSDKYNVITAENGQEALKLIDNVEQAIENDSSLMPDLIISDIMMPLMDGFQLLEKLKTAENLQSIPIVILTARAEMQDRLKALRIGVDDYLTKPFEEEELFARVKNLLHNAQVRKQMQQEDLVALKSTQQPTAEIISLPLSKNERNQLSSENRVWLADLEKTIQQHIGDYNLSVDFIADEMHISRAQFYRRLQLLTGLTPNQYLQEIRFNHARQLLEKRNVSSVKAASAAIGIQKVQYFSEQFKERFGKLPSSYL